MRETRHAQWIRVVAIAKTATRDGRTMRPGAMFFVPASEAGALLRSGQVELAAHRGDAAGGC